MICGSGGSKSRLAKAAGAEPAGQMRDEKLHAVVARSTFRSQNVQNTPFSDHFWKLRCRKSARRCGGEAHFEVKMYKTHHCRTTFGSCDVEKVHAVVARSTFRSQNAQNTPFSDHFWKLRCRKNARRCGAKHISKWKCTKHHMFAPLLEAQMSKKCTPFWREAHFEVKLYKTPHVRATFGGSDVEKVHAVLARSTFRSQNVKNTRGLDHFWRFRCRFASLHYNTLHYTTLHFATLHYITLPFTTLHYTTLHSTTLQLQLHNYTPLHSTTLNYTTLHYTTLHYTTLHYITRHYTPQQYNYNYTTTLHYTKWHYTTLHYTTLHYTTLHYTTLHYLPLHFTTLHYTTLHYTTTTTTTTQLHSTTPRYTKLHYTTLHYTTLHYNCNYTTATTQLHSTTLHYTTTTPATTQLHSTTRNYTTIHDTTLHYIPLHSTTLHYTTLHYTEWHCTTDRQVDR